MPEDVSESQDGKKGKKPHDHAEVEFEFGNIGFEAKGRSAVVERMFRLLLDRIEAGSLVASFTLEEMDEEEELVVEEEEELPETQLDEEVVVEDEDYSRRSIEPPPSWDSLENEEPEMTDAEREEMDQD